ncbi:MAG: DUF4136 domain-containing protein [Thermoanaerobaculia bacterium]
MKRAWLFPIALVVAVGCSTVKTTADYDPSTNFASYKTWSWKETEKMDSLWSKRIQSALQTELAKKGLTQVDSGGDLLVVAHVRLSQETQITSYNTGWGYGWRRGGTGMSTASVQQVPVGTLIVDLVDVKKNELAWRGTASDTLNPEKSVEEKEKALSEAIAKMFEGYPPKG